MTNYHNVTAASIQFLNKLLGNIQTKQNERDDGGVDVAFK